MRIVFDFAGGPLDGRSSVADTELPTGLAGLDKIAQKYWQLTDLGAIGGRFWTASDYGMMSIQGHAPEPVEETIREAHTYEVAERLEEGDDVFLHCRYLGMVE